MSFLQQVQVQLNGLPVVMICLSNGAVVFVKLPGKDVLSMSKEGADFHVSDECIKLYTTDGECFDVEYQTMYNYKEHHVMLKWLQGLDLQNLFTGEFRDV